MTPASIAFNRFGLGARPAETIGEPRAWLGAQLSGSRPVRDTIVPAPSTRDAATVIADFIRDRRALRDSPNKVQAVQERRRAYARKTRELHQVSVTARLNTALVSEVPFVDRLVYFWSNHFAVSAKATAVRALAGPFEAEAIRPHVLGSFRDLLLAAERHPAMLIYLDQVRSAGPDSPAARRRAKRPVGLNENLAREILELHTLGVRTGYTQRDVTEFARALTGWGADGLAGAGADGTPGAFAFAADRHQPGARTILGKRYGEGGAEQGEAVLEDLAAHPVTARHLATKLTRHFAGTPEPSAMVDRLTAAFTRSGGDLPTVYRALIASPEAWAERPLRFRSPWEWAVAVLRASGVRDSASDDAVGMFTQLGQPVWQPLQPSGWDDDDASWAAPDALMRRVEEAERLAATISDRPDARALAARLFPGAVGPATGQALARAETPAQGLALLFCAPEMMRR